MPPDPLNDLPLMWKVLLPVLGLYFGWLLRDWLREKGIWP